MQWGFNMYTICLVVLLPGVHTWCNIVGTSIEISSQDQVADCCIMQMNKALKCRAKATSRPNNRTTALRCQAQNRPLEFLKSGLGAAAIIAASPSIAHADALALADNSSMSLAISGGVAIAGLGAVLVATDPQKR